MARSTIAERVVFLVRSRLQVIRRAVMLQSERTRSLQSLMARKSRPLFCAILALASVMMVQTEEAVAQLALGVKGGRSRAWVSEEAPPGRVGGNDHRSLWHVGVTASLPLGKRIAIRVETVYSQMGTVEGGMGIIDMSYLDLSMLTKFSFPSILAAVLSPSVIAGGVMAAQLSCEFEWRSSRESCERTSIEGTRGMDMRLLLGFGIDVPISGFTFEVTAVYQHGLVDLVPDQWYLDFNRAVMLSAGIALPLSSG